MCSITAAQLARIIRAIEELAGHPGADEVTADAGQASAADGSRAAPGDGGQAAADRDLAARLAAVWAMVAEADPELAKRVQGYLDAAD